MRYQIIATDITKAFDKIAAELANGIADAEGDTTKGRVTAGPACPRPRLVLTAQLARYIGSEVCGSVLWNDPSDAV